MSPTPFRRSPTRRALRPALLAALAAAFSAASAPRAETIEDIVAWVNDDIITRSDLDRRDRENKDELLQRVTGDELARRLAEVRQSTLRDMISEKLLLQQAERIYDMRKMEESLLRNFKEQEKVASDEQLAEMLRAEGMTIEDLKRRLMDYNGPRSVIQYEVRDKISVSDAEVEAWYRANGATFAAPAGVRFREIVILSEGRGQEAALAEARNLAERARAGADFAQLAAENSQAPSKDRILGPFQKGELHPEIEKAAFSLPVGTISDPIAVEHGAHLIKVESRSEAEAPPLEEVREKIFDKLADEKFRKEISVYLKRLWAGADIEVARGFLDRIATDYRTYVHQAPTAGLK